MRMTITTPRLTTIPGVTEISEANPGRITEEIISQTIRLRAGKTPVEIILPVEQTTTPTTHGEHRPILRRGVICLLLRAEAAMRTITLETLGDKTTADGITTEVMDPEEIMVGVEETRARHGEQKLHSLEEVGLMGALDQPGHLRLMAPAGEGDCVSTCWSTPGWH